MKNINTITVTVNSLGEILDENNENVENVKFYRITGEDNPDAFVGVNEFAEYMDMLGHQIRIRNLIKTLPFDLSNAISEIQESDLIAEDTKESYSQDFSFLSDILHGCEKSIDEISEKISEKTNRNEANTQISLTPEQLSYIQRNGLAKTVFETNITSGVHEGVVLSAEDVAYLSELVDDVSEKVQYISRKVSEILEVVTPEEYEPDDFIDFSDDDDFCEECRDYITLCMCDEYDNYDNDEVEDDGGEDDDDFLYNQSQTLYFIKGDSFDDEELEKQEENPRSIDGEKPQDESDEEDTDSGDDDVSPIRTFSELFDLLTRNKEKREKKEKKNTFLTERDIENLSEISRQLKEIFEK